MRRSRIEIKQILKNQITESRVYNMGFFSDFFNIESPQFETILKPTAVKEFSKENDNIKALNELLSKLNNDKKKELVNKEIIAIKMGLQGEGTVDFELRNCTLPLLYLHDIRIEYDDLVTQIDYLVITKKYICVMETKQLLGDVNINNDGEFSRVYKNKNGYENKTGMYSPIEQNRKHVNLIKKILKEGFDCDNVPVRSLVIMANPKAIIRKSYASKEIQDQIIRAEKLCDYVQDLDNELKNIVIKEETAFKIANYFKEKHTPISIDYKAKFGIAEQDFNTESIFDEKAIEKENATSFNDSEVSEKLIDEKVERVFVLSESDKKLTEKLKLYRNEKAKEEGYNSFKYHLIFSSSTINNLVEIKPQTNAQLFEIKGLAQVKINKYGDDVLKIIREHVAKSLDSNEKLDTEDDPDKEVEIRNKLKQYRAETSKKENIKPYVVFNNEQMEEIIKSKPKTKEQLLIIRGFGEIKVKKYGEAIVNIFN